MQRLDALTGLRFFAASAIVLHHLQGLIWIPSGTFAPFNLGNGVSFFFCLSGFILHYNYRTKIKDIPYFKFLFIRYFRLWPAHLAALAFVVYLSPTIFHRLEPLTAGAITRVFFMVHSLTPDMNVYYAWNGPSWSISTEFFFYAAFPLLCILATKRPGVVLAGVAGFVALYLFVAEAFLFDPSIKGNAHGLGSISPLPRMLEFAAGVVTCEFVIFRHGSSKLRAGTSMEAAAVALLILGLWLSPSILPWSRSSLGAVAADYLRAAILFPLFCVLIAVVSWEAGAISRFLGRKELVWLGNVSFSIYLTHQPVIYFFRRYMPEMEAWRQIPLYLLIVIAVSAGIFYFVEQPGIRFSRNLVTFGRRSTAR